MNFQPSTFTETVTKLLYDSGQSLEFLVDAYLWAQTHIKEIHKSNPTYRQWWLQQEIQRVFSVDVQTYARTATRLGGGTSSENQAAGRDIIRRFGVYETFRAERLLSEDQMNALHLHIEKDATIDEFRSLVDKLAIRLERMADGSIEKGRDYKLECIRLQSKLGALEKENKRLHVENEILKSKLAKIRSATETAISVS